MLTQRFTARSGPGHPHPTPTAAVTAVLTEAFDALPEPARADAPLYVLCGDYSRFAARRFVGRCGDPTRRLRPSDSTALEASELIRPYTTAAGHRGMCYLLAGTAAWDAVGSALTEGDRPTVECRISLFEEADPTPGCLAVATVRGVAR